MGRVNVPKSLPWTSSLMLYQFFKEKVKKNMDIHFIQKSNHFMLIKLYIKYYIWFTCDVCMHNVWTCSSAKIKLKNTYKKKLLTKVIHLLWKVYRHTTHLKSCSEDHYILREHLGTYIYNCWYDDPFVILFCVGKWSSSGSAVVWFGLIGMWRGMVYHMNNR